MYVCMYVTRDTGSVGDSVGEGEDLCRALLVYSKLTKPEFLNPFKTCAASARARLPHSLARRLPHSLARARPPAPAAVREERPRTHPWSSEY